jgi:hypothetical protein
MTRAKVMNNSRNKPHHQQYRYHKHQETETEQHQHQLLI